MKAITIGWNKKSVDQVQFLYNVQSFQQNPTDEINHQGKTFNKKKVHFSSHPPPDIRQAFENTHTNHPRINELDKSTFDDQNDSLSSRTHIFSTELAAGQNEPICSIRATVIVFVIVLLIILATALTIGIVLGTLSSSSNSAKTSTQNPNGNLFSAAATTASMTSSISLGSQSGTPCASYTTIDDPSRNVAQIGFAGSCDNGVIFNTSNHGAWIRFVGSGGTIMPSSSPGYGHCGSFVTGWFNGTLPVTIGTMVNESICFSAYIDDCLISVNSIAMYCSGSFYVYFLPPVPICNSRYCTT